MAASNERLILEPLRTSDSFLRDLRLFFDTPTELLRVVAKRTGLSLYEPLFDADTDELSDQFEWRAEDIRRVAALIIFLRQRLIDTGRNPMDAIAESRGLLDQEDLAIGREEEIASVLSYSADEREEALALEAFSGGPAFLSTRIRPSLLPVETPGVELVGNYLWTISYLNAEGEQRSVTIGLTPGELEQLERTIDRAKGQLRTIRNLTNPARTADS